MEEAIKELVNGICNIDYGLLKQQKDWLIAFEGYSDEIEGILSLLDFIQDWIEDNPEVVMEYRL